MKKTLIFIFGIMLWQTSFSNINSIKLSNISFAAEIKEDLDFVIDNQTMFNHWTPKWNYDISKNKCLKRLKAIALVCENNAKSYDEFLLKGTIAHYRYNLNDEKEGPVSINAFRSASNINSKDYRAYWFLANHYAHSTKTDSSIYYFLKAESMELAINNSEFWEEYAFAFYLANMPSHTIQAMEKANEILGELCYFDYTLGKIVREKLKTPEADETYEMKDIWTAKPEGEKFSFVNRPLGFKLSVDSTWTLNFGKYNKRMVYAIMTPDGETNSSGKEITYSIMVIAHIPEKGETLEEYADKFTNKFEDKKPNSRYNQYNPELNYEILDSTTYQDIGGAHTQYLFFSRQMPKYPGLELEIPSKLKNTNKKKITFYEYKSSYSRFEGEIMYMVMLDTCEDIYDKSLKVFDAFLEDLIIE